MTNSLVSLSEDLAGAVEQAGQFVVRVEGRRRLPASGIAWSTDEIIVTANHVVQRDDSLVVGLPSGKEVKAELVGRDPHADLAVLRISGGISGEVWESTQTLKVGHLVLALGRPSKRIMATHGIVSAKADEWHTPHGSKLDHYLQTDVVMYPGFSGGPLVDANGTVIGMNTSGLMRGISITLPSEIVESRVAALIKHGYIRRGYLGVSLQPVRLPSAIRQKLDQEAGLLIAGIEDASPAEEAKLFQGDVLISVDGQSLRYPDDLSVHLNLEKIGKKIQLGLIRGGEQVQLEIMVGERKGRE